MDYSAAEFAVGDCFAADYSEAVFAGECFAAEGCSFVEDCLSVGDCLYVGIVLTLIILLGTKYCRWKFCC